MNRIQYWFRAHTRYNLHSPFLFALYDEVLMARLDSERSKSLPSCGERRYRELVYKITDFFSMRQTEVETDMTVLVGDGVLKKAVVVRRPHRSAEFEQRWKEMAETSGCNIVIDLFDVGLLLHNPRLRPQQWLLR